MLLPYYTKQDEKWKKELDDCLQNGLQVSNMFERLKIDGEFLISLYFAEKHGDLANTLLFVGEQMQYKSKMKKQLFKILSYPIFMFILLLFFFFAFRLYFLPNISQMIHSRSDDASSSLLWSKIFLHMPDYFIAIGIFIFILAIIAIRYISKKSIDFQLHFIYRLPIIGPIYRLLLTRQYARNLGFLIQAGFTLQQAMGELKTQYFQPKIQFVAEKVEKQILNGESMSDTVRSLPYFYSKFDLFVSHGEKSGLLGRELLLYCEILDEKLKTKLSGIFKFIQPLFFMIIAICIMAAYLSILLPMYKMIDIV